MPNNSKKLSLMGRRRFMESLTAMGLSSEVVSHMTQDELESLTGDPTDEVPRIGSLQYPNEEKYGEPPYPETPSKREPEYYTIPRDEWIVVESAFDAAENIQKQINEIDDTGLVSAGVAINRSGRSEDYSVIVKRNTAVVGSIESLSDKINIPEVDISAQDIIEQGSNTEIVKTPNVILDDLMGELPDTTEGTVGDKGMETATRDNIPIEFSEEVTWNEACSDEQCEVTDNSNERFFTGQYRYYEGSEYHTGTGCKITIDPDGYDTNLTLGPRVQPTDGGSHMMMTSAHGAFRTTDAAEENDDIDPEDPQNAIGRDVYQGQISDFYKIGDIKDVKHDDGDALTGWDAALIEMSRPTGNINAGNRLASDSMINTFSGSLASSRIGKDYIKDQKGPICKQGYRTGRCQHTIRDYVPMPGSSPDQIELYRDNSDGGGNSGSTYFANRDGDLEVAGMHNWGKSETYRVGSGRSSGVLNIAAGIWIGDIEDAFNVQVV